jgi:glycosyltransferase involved in cell wall biosynthesis
VTAPMISVVVPCYNRERYLEATLKSLLWQTIDSWECILVDDGSTDGSAALYRRYAAADPRFRYHLQENQGPSAARNAGVAMARGEYVQFLDSDDIIPKERFALCAARFAADPDTDVVYTNYVGYQRERGFLTPLPARIPGEDPLRALLFEQNQTFATVIHSFLFKRTVIASHPFDLGFRNLAEDIECWVRMAADGVRFSYLDEVLAVYRYSDDSIAARESLLYTMRLKVLDKYRSDPRFARYAAEFPSAECRLKQRLAVGHFMDRSFRTGWTVLAESWSCSSWPARARMLLWGFLLLFFRTETIARVRSWVIEHTPLRWGGWVHATSWNAPPEVRELLESSR